MNCKYFSNKSFIEWIFLYYGLKFEFDDNFKSDLGHFFK
jgi:hypothetical protein